MKVEKKSHNTPLREKAENHEASCANGILLFFS